MYTSWRHPYFGPLHLCYLEPTSLERMRARDQKQVGYRSRVDDLWESPPFLLFYSNELRWWEVLMDFRNPLTQYFQPMCLCFLIPQP